MLSYRSVVETVSLTEESFPREGRLCRAAGSRLYCPQAERARPLCDGAPFPKATNQEETGPFSFPPRAGWLKAKPCQGVLFDTEIPFHMLFVKRAVYSRPVMPRVSKLKLPPLPMGEHSIGRRLAQLRKQRGYTQNELAQKMGLIQSLVSSYELDKLRLSAEMLVRFSVALDTGVDTILGINGKSRHDTEVSLSLVRRMKEIESLPVSKRKALLQTIDGFLKAEKL